MVMQLKLLNMLNVVPLSLDFAVCLCDIACDKLNLIASGDMNTSVSSCW